MNKKRKAIIDGNEVSYVKTYKLGGFDQKVLIEGKRKDLPIVITLHGGPGTPIPFCVGGRGLFPELTDQCILVSWDQYGCGINNAVLEESISISDFVQMTKDLIHFIKKDFEENKIFLFGMSWGSVLAAKTAVDIPNAIDGVIIYGQVLKKLMCTEDAVKALMNSEAPQKVKEQMKKVFAKDSPDYGDVRVISKWIRRYTEGYQNKKEPKVDIGRIIRGIIASPDYRFKDFIAIVRNGYMKNQSIVEELSELDLSDTLSKIEIPYHIIQGDTDIVTSTKEISNFINKCPNTYLRLERIESASHYPGSNGINAVMRAINNIQKLSGI